MSQLCLHASVCPCIRESECLRVLEKETLCTFCICNYILSHRKVRGALDGGTFSLHLALSLYPSSPPPGVGLNCTETNYPHPPRCVYHMHMVELDADPLHEWKNVFYCCMMSPTCKRQECFLMCLPLLFFFPCLLSCQHAFQRSTTICQVSLMLGSNISASLQAGVPCCSRCCFQYSIRTSGSMTTPCLPIGSGQRLYTPSTVCRIRKKMLTLATQMKTEARLVGDPKCL